jgi:septal ring factor EnvC (AmiA/AmiB activator)
MMKNKANNTVMDELNEVLTSDDVFTDAAETQSIASKKAEKKLHINNSILLDIITDQTRAKFIWQCVAVFLCVCLIASGVMYFDLYKDNKILNDKALNTAKLESKLSDSKAETEKLKADVLKAYSDLTAVRGQLDISRAETADAKAKLDELTNQLNNLQRRNAEVVKILNGRLQKLSGQTDSTLKK